MRKINFVFVALITIISCHNVNSTSGIKENSPEASVIKFLKLYRLHLKEVSNFRFVNEIKPDDNSDFYK